MINIKVIPKSDMLSILPLVQLLNPKEHKDTLQSRVNKLAEMENYFCLGVYENEELIACCGVWQLHKIYAGAHLEVDNVCVLPEKRGNKIGELLMEWISEYAQEHHYNSIELNAYIINEKAVSFWEKVGFVKKGYHMIKFL